MQIDIKKLSKIEIDLIKKIKKLISIESKEKLEKPHEKYYVESLSGNSVENMRALEFLSNKNLVELGFDSYKVVKLTDLGEKVKKIGLPEERLLRALKRKNEVYVNEILNDNESKLNKQEINIAIGQLKRLGVLNVVKDKNGLKLILKSEPKILESMVLKLNFPVEFEKLDDLQRELINRLQKRGIVKIEEKKSWWFKPKKELLKISLNELDLIEEVSDEVIEKELWKKRSFRHYDLISKMPIITGGRKHFLTEIIEQIKQIWLEMGFKEMEGDVVQTSFWNLDALFVPQDHPARGLQDSLFVEKNGKIALGKIKEKDFMKKVKEVHENGNDTESVGWQQSWDENIAKQLMLRTHTTVLSVKTLYKLRKMIESGKIQEPEGKFFAIGKVFRNETLDWKHLFEFHQIEGIVVGKVNFRHLIYYLKRFYAKLGFENIRIIPSYYPYTEPSADIEVFVESRGEWMELGGSGMFRPEVVKPILGDVNVLAWGMGLERIIMMKYGFKDIRNIYTHDIDFLKRRPL